MRQIPGLFDVLMVTGRLVIFNPPLSSDIG